MTAAVTEYRDRATLIDVREERDYWLPVEFREDKKSGDIVVEGYAATYDPYDVQGGPAAGGWVEQLRSTAFDKTLASQPDVQLLVNHEGMPLARTTSGTLKLSRDGHGLRFSATLDGTDPDVQRLAPKMRRGDMNECSFAFRVKDQTWDSSYSHRTINDLTLEKGDVSVVNYGMNPGTRAVLSDAIGALAQLSSRDLVELRSDLNQDQVRRAQAMLAAMLPAGSLRKDTPKEPHGDVTYADPGYKADGKKRYPIDSKDHAKAAWSYINMPKNHTGYTAEQVSAIKGRIKGALKKFGVTVSEEKAAVKVSYIDESVRADGNTTLVAVMSDGSRVPLPTQRALPSARSAFTGNGEAEWHPSDSPQDPHDEPFKEGDEMGTVGAGPIPDNIEGGGDSFAPDHPAYHDPGPEKDPHDQSVSAEMCSADPHDDPTEAAVFGGGSKTTPVHGAFAGEGGGDPHDTPYNVGAQVGSVPGDKPNYGDFPQGKVEPNIVTGGSRGPGTNVGANHVPGITAPPGVGTEPVGSDARYDWTSGTISQPSSPAQNLDAPAERSDDSDGPYGSDHGHDIATHAKKSDSWAPTNIVTSASGAGNTMGDADCNGLDLGMAQALDRTIVHSYQLAKGNTELRKALAVAWKQLNSLRGVAAPKNNEITRKLAELRKEVGAPDTGSVDEGLQYLRSMGSAPIGYRGLLDSDPDLHVVGAAERMAKDKAHLARQSALESGEAEARVKAARREAELNDVIRRRMQAN